jgi:hypothetical protein
VLTVLTLPFALYAMAGWPERADGNSYRPALTVTGAAVAWLTADA